MGRDEEIADGGEDGNEPLQASRRSKALHRPLASSQRQVRVLGPVVEALVRAMLDCGHDLAPGGGIGAELVGNHAPGRAALLLEKVVVQTLEVEPIRGLEVALDHAASTAFQISGAVLCLTRSLSSLN